MGTPVVYGYPDSIDPHRPIVCFARQGFLLKQNGFDAGQGFIDDGLRHRFLEPHVPRPPVQ